MSTTSNMDDELFVAMEIRGSTKTPVMVAGNAWKSYM